MAGLNQDNDKSVLLTRYLLGEMGEAEEVSVEQRFFEDPAFLDELRATECDLLDEYVRGELKGERREGFERRFLAAPGRRRRVLFADVLEKAAVRRHNAADAQQSTTSRTGGRAKRFHVGARYRLILAVAAVLVVAFFGVSLWLGGGFREQGPAPVLVEEQPAPQAPGSPPAASPPVTEPGNPAPQASVATFLLKARRLRGEPANRLVIAPGVKTVRLVIQLRLHDYAGYKVTMQTPDHEVVWQSGLLNRVDGGGRLSVQIAASQFGNRDYLVVVKGANSGGQEEDVGDYYFEVVRK